ncbi:OLC1v1035079C1 [Oldenlandia corymbosa var. corymbosa]|uniref:OLC1v1035079C1 n=1 Tax=Oldenlandia corymbosa var. corymbosa TaxID=529605 RepID=A0AAV1CSW8_OLDCO|nr:OLC1v1035079C1 [Oldenlandia corymbosa var. corymbosa]
MESEILEKFETLSLSSTEKERVVLGEDDTKRGREEGIRSLIGKIFGDKRMKFYGVKNAIEKSLRQKSLGRVDKLQSNTFQFIFSKEAERDAVMRQRPWSFDGHFMVLEKWADDIDMDTEIFNFSSVWVQIWNTAVHWISKEIGQKLGRMLGEVRDVIIPDVGGTEYKHIKILVEMDLRRRLERGTWLTYNSKEGLASKREKGECSGVLKWTDVVKRGLRVEEEEYGKSEQMPGERMRALTDLLNRARQAGKEPIVGGGNSDWDDDVEMEQNIEVDDMSDEGEPFTDFGGWGERQALGDITNKEMQEGETVSMGGVGNKRNQWKKRARITKGDNKEKGKGKKLGKGDVNGKRMRGPEVEEEQNRAAKLKRRKDVVISNVENRNECEGNKENQLYEIWKSRNTWCFEGKRVEAMDVVQAAGVHDLELQRWKPSEKGVVRINVNSMMKTGDHEAGLGFCVRDTEGKMLLAMAMHQGKVLSPFAAELEVIRVKAVLSIKFSEGGMSWEIDLSRPDQRPLFSNTDVAPNWFHVPGGALDYKNGSDFWRAGLEMLNEEFDFGDIPVRDDLVFPDDDDDDTPSDESSETRKGSTCLALVFKEGAMVAVAHSHPISPDRLPENVFAPDTRTLALFSGKIANWGPFLRDFGKKCSLHGCSEGSTSLEAASQSMVDFLSSCQEEEGLSESMIVGWDGQVPSLYAMNDKGKLLKSNFTAIGRGSESAFISVELRYRYHLSFAEAKGLAGRAMCLSAIDTVRSGDESDRFFSVYHVGPNGRMLIASEEVEEYYRRITSW